MRKLLSANFSRLWKSTCFWCCMIFMVLFGCARSVIASVSGAEAVDDGMFIYMLVMMLVQGTFIALFIGNEHHYNTLRNKLVIGHLRRNIYLSNFVACTAAGWLFSIGYFISSLLIGIPAIGEFRAEWSQIVASFVCGLLLTVVYTGIYLLVSMLNHNHATSAVIILLLAVVFFVTGSGVVKRLEQPEQHEIMEFNNDGTLSSSQFVDNPSYLQGQERTLYEFIYDTFPGCQSIRLSYMYNEISMPPLKLIYYDLILVFLLNGAGVLLFERKNIK